MPRDKKAKKCGTFECHDLALYQCEDKDVDGKVWYRCKKHRCERCKRMKEDKNV